MILVVLVSLLLLEVIVMVEFSFDLDTSPIGKLPGKMKKAQGLGLKYATEDMVRFLMENSPVDHGLLRQWFIDSIDDEQATIKSPAEYAIYQDQGTRDHMIKPVNAKALHWDSYFSKGHMVRGIQGKHFVEKSFEQVRPLVPGYFLKAMEEAD